MSSRNVKPMIHYALNCQQLWTAATTVSEQQIFCHRQLPTCHRQFSCWHVTDSCRHVTDSSVADTSPTVADVSPTVADSSQLSLIQCQYVNDLHNFWSWKSDGRWVLKMRGHTAGSITLVSQSLGIWAHVGAGNCGEYSWLVRWLHEVSLLQWCTNPLDVILVALSPWLTRVMHSCL